MGGCPFAAQVAVRPEAEVAVVGVELAGRAESGLARGLDVGGGYAGLAGGLAVAEPDWVVSTRHVVPDGDGFDHAPSLLTDCASSLPGRPSPGNGQVSFSCRP